MEAWRNIRGYPGYRVSNTGKVKNSISRTQATG